MRVPLVVSAALVALVAGLAPGGTEVLAREKRQGPKDRCHTKCDSIMLECHGRADQAGTAKERVRLGDKCNENHRECQQACNVRYPN